MIHKYDCSICITAHSRPEAVRRTLESIRSQRTSSSYEIVLVDDRSAEPLFEIAGEFGVERYVRLSDAKERCNPSTAASIGYRVARGRVLILQQADVMHASENCIDMLVDLPEKTAYIAEVWNYDIRSGKRLSQYTGRGKGKRPYMFLGSAWRRDVYAAGGLDEDFDRNGFDDDWFWWCMKHGAGVDFKIRGDILGFHQDHERSYHTKEGYRSMRSLLESKVAEARKSGAFVASGGSWVLP